MKNRVLPLLLLLSLTSCHKEENSPSKTDLLTARNWRLTANTIVLTLSGVSTTTDGYAPLYACERDNFLTFKRDKHLVYDQGPIACPTSPQTITNQWDWLDNETTIAYIPSQGNTGVVKWQLVELTPNTLRLRETFHLPSGTDKEVTDWTYTGL